MKLVRILATIAPIALIAACSGAGEHTDGTDESLARDPGDPAEVAEPRPTDPLPPHPPRHCRSTDATCSIEPWVLTDEEEAVRVRLGCNRAFRWFSGANAGLLGGILSRCPDTPAVRAYFHMGYGATFCDKCMPPAGHHHLYAFWMSFVGPNCSSSCKYGPPPDPI